MTSRERCIDTFGHEWRIIGTPRSEMTFKECRKCYRKEPRGEGLFRERFELGLFEARAVTGRDFVEERDCAGNPTGYFKFFNTTNETGPQLAEYQAKAGEQNEIVMRIFRTITWPLSPSQVLSYFPAPQPPLTSIRRAITTLTQAGALVKTETKRKGVYGRMEHVWTLPEANDSACQSPD